MPHLSIGEALYRPVPGRGVLHTQAALIPKDHPSVAAALSLVIAEPPMDVLEAMKSLDGGSYLSETWGPPNYPDYEFRQNAVADLNGEAASYTGAALGELYESIGYPGTENTGDNGTAGNFTFSAQGNVVTKGTVGSVMLGFAGLLGDLGTGCDLAERLMIAMEAVPLTNTGDSRCLGEHGTPASGAFLRVDAADGTALVDIDIVGDGTEDPTAALREKYKRWRETNTCPGGLSPEEAPSESPAPSGASNLARRIFGTFVFLTVASCASVAL